MVLEIYNVVGEVASLSFGLMILALMLFTSPRITFVYKLCSIGLFLSVVANVLNIIIIKLAADAQTCDPLMLGVLEIIFIVVFFFIGALLFSYISFLSAKRRRSASVVNWIILIVAVVYVIAALRLMGSSELLVVNNNVFEIYKFEEFIMYSAAATMILSIVITIIDYENLSRFVRRVVALYVVIDLFVFQMQYIFYPHIFISISYVVPFAIFYIVFHANPHDELMGTQDKNALETKIRQDAIAGKSSLLMFIQVPRLSNIDFLTDANAVYLHTARCARKLESIGFGISIFNLGYGEFAIRFDNKYFINVFELMEYVVEILNEFVEFDEDRKSVV